MKTETYDSPVAAEALQLAGKYLIFKVADEEYGVAILKVRELIGLMEITHVPRTPPWVRGILNLRGKVVPVIDLRVKFGMSRAEATDQNVIIVLQFANAAGAPIMGVLVDEASEVLDLRAPQIEPPPSFGVQAVDADFILGVAKSDARVIFLLDLDRVLHPDEHTAVAGAAR